jgi:transcription initiation factor IIE alpha subunit
MTYACPVCLDTSDYQRRCPRCGVGMEEMTKQDVCDLEERRLLQTAESEAMEEVRG